MKIRNRANRGTFCPYLAHSEKSSFVKTVDKVCRETCRDSRCFDIEYSLRAHTSLSCEGWELLTDLSDDICKASDWLRQAPQLTLKCKPSREEARRL